MSIGRTAGVAIYPSGWITLLESCVSSGDRWSDCAAVLLISFLLPANGNWIKKKHPSWTGSYYLIVEKQVSLDSRVREIVNRNMVDPTPHTFDEAQLQIYTLMHRDSYPRFVNSAYYKKLAQLSSTSRKESSAWVLHSYWRLTAND